MVSRVGKVAGGGLVQLAAYSVAVLLGVATVVRVVRRRPWSDAAWRHAMPLVWLVLPFAVVVASTYTAKPLLVGRFLIVVVPALAMVAALGVVRCRDRRLAAVVAAALIIVSVLGVASWHREDGREPWRQATASVLAAAAPGDALVVVPAQLEPTVEYYLRRLDGPPLDLVRPAADDEASSGRLWEIASNPDAGPAPPWDPLRDYDEWRDDHYSLAGERTFDDMVVRQYELVEP
jgi:hypothetical protein